MIVCFSITAEALLTRYALHTVSMTIGRCQTSRLTFDNIQLMHSFEVNVRISQPEDSDIHRGLG